MDIGAKAFNAVTQTVTAGATASLAANSEAWDTHSFHDNAVNNERLSFTVGGPGKYIVSWACKSVVTFSTDETPFSANARVQLNGTTDQCESQDCGYMWRFVATVNNVATSVEQNSVCLGRTFMIDIASATDFIEVRLTNGSTSHSMTIYEFFFSVQKVNVAGAL